MDPQVPQVCVRSVIKPMITPIRPSSRLCFGTGVHQTTSLLCQWASCEVHVVGGARWDLCFIDDNDKLILCDYKTDRIPREIINDREATTSYLEDRHAEQLKYYAKAIERIMGKSPDQILIYSLSFGDALEINV